MSRQTKGAFDITIGPLYDCWLDKDRTPRKPSKKDIEAALKKTGSNLLVLNESEHTVTLANRRCSGLISALSAKVTQRIKSHSYLASGG